MFFPYFFPSPILSQLEADPEARLRFIICDTLARHFLKGLISHTGRFACECCIAKGVTKPAMNWPFHSEFNKPLRNEEQMKFVAE